MTVRKITTLLAACFLFAAPAATVSAQLVPQAQLLQDDPFNDSGFEHDLQFFAPVDFDFDNQPVKNDSGWFFSYDKLSWAIQGESTTLGDPGRTVVSEQIYIQNAQDEGVRPDPYVIPNGIQNSAPNAEFAWGERYEFGKLDNGNGWIVSILDGPESSSTSVFGFGPNTPFLDPDYTDGDDVPAGIDPITGFPLTNGPVGDARAFGFGSVHVNFEMTPGFLIGFRDYLQNFAGAQQGTVGGPILYVGNYGNPEFTEGNDTDDPTLFRRADDLDGDGLFGTGILIDDEGNIVLVTDFDDLHEFNIAFDQVFVHNTTETQGVEVMKTFALSNKHKLVKNQNASLDIAYGVRYFRLRDQFFFRGDGSVVGQTSVDNRIDNNIVGPQIRTRWNKQQGRVNWSFDGRFLFGYNASNWDQVGLFGQELIPGALNRPLYAQPTASAHGRHDNDFSPMAEIRAEASYQITTSISAKLGYNAIFIDNIHRAASEVRWRAPDWGFVGQESQEIFINGVNFGFDVVY
jgi:hypothetical protein